MLVVTALGLALLMVVVMSISGGRHGPGRHLSSAEFDAPVMQSAGPASFFSADDASALKCVLMALPPALRRAMLQRTSSAPSDGSVPRPPTSP